MGLAGVNSEVQVAEVFSLDYEGRGVARCNGKTVFISGALPKEKVSYRIRRSKKQFDEAETVAVLRSSAERVAPKCRYFEICGGCTLQHASVEAQVAYKQRIFEEQLVRIGKVWPQTLLPAIYGTAWGYRQRARLSVSVDGEGRLLLGFQARKTNNVMDIDCCPVLPAPVSAALPEIKAVLQQLFAAGLLVNYIEFFQGDALIALNISIRERPSEKVLSVRKASVVYSI